MEGRVVRIFDAQRIAINLGSDAGVEAGMEFEIYSTGDTVRDPETDEPLGTYRLRKAVVVAREVFPRFSIAVPPQVRERVEDAAANINQLFRGAQYRMVPGRLSVDSASVEPLLSGSKVTLGDVVLPVGDPEAAAAGDS